MTRFALVVVLGAFLLVVASPAGAGELVRCTGRVLDAGGAPVAGAEVTLLQWSSDDQTSEVEVTAIGQAVAEANGAFAIAASIRPDADAVVVAHKKGLACHWAWLQRPRMPAPLALRLGKAASMEGVVVDAAGKPVAGALVRCEPHIQGPTDITYLPRQASLDWLHVKTDKDGRFRIEGVPARSRSLLEVSAPGKAPKDTGDECYTDWWAMCPHAAGDGNIRVVLADEAAIEGHVIEKASGKPVAGMKVFAQEPLVISPAAVVTDKAGKFRIGGLTEGAHTVSIVQPKDRLADWVPASRNVAAKAGKTQGVTLKLAKGGILEVTVVDAEDEEPVAGAEVSVAVTEESVSEEPDANLPPQETAPTFTAVTDAQGVARLRLPESACCVSASKAGEYESEQAEDSVNVRDGQTVQAEIAMSQRVTRMRCVALDPNGRPVPGVVICGGESGGYMDRGQTDAAGEFELEAAGDGTTTSLLRDEVRNLVGVAVLTADANGLVKIELAPGATIRGRVVDESNRPIAIAAVTLTGEGDVQGAGADIGSSDTVAGDDGRIEIRAVPPGRYTLTACAYGYGETPVEVEVPSDANGPVMVEDLVLALADQTVTGTVVDAAGKPVAGASVSVSGEGQPERDAITADDAGKFTIRRLVKGPVTLTADADMRSGTLDAEAGAKDVKVVVREEDSRPPMQSGEDF